MKARNLIKYTCYLLFLTICIFSLIDTNLFVYPSLSQSLSLEFGVLIMTMVSVCMGVKRKVCVLDSKYDLFFLLWIAYVWFHFSVNQPHEIYRTLYLCITLFMVLSIKWSIKIGLFSKTGVEDGLILIAVIHLFYILMQMFGLIDSSNKYFTIVGASKSPTVTALYLVGVLPLLISRIREKNNKVFYVVLLALSLLGICILKCRSAYIGGVVAILVYIIMYNRKRSFFPFKKSSKNIIFFIIVAIICSLLVVQLYKMKKNSADGRLLIWKLSVELIRERPQGYGYGLFEKIYNLKQSNYFLSGNSPVNERRNADFVRMPYNDFLEHGVEGGAIGMLFLLLFYVMMIRKAAKENKCMETAILVSFCVMSLTNFVYTSIQPWLLLMCTSGFILIGSKGNADERQKAKMLLSSMFILGLTIIAVYELYVLSFAQMALKKLSEASNKIEALNDSCYEVLAKDIGSSEAYWTCRAKNNMKQGNFMEARYNLLEARKYSSSPEILRRQSVCLFYEGMCEEGIAYVDTLNGIQPYKLAYKQQLMRYYLANDIPQKVKSYARDIVEVGAKIKTEEAICIINEAKNVLKGYEK